jgi:hypothetical protein
MGSFRHKVCAVQIGRPARPRQALADGGCRNSADHAQLNEVRVAGIDELDTIGHETVAGIERNRAIRDASVRTIAIAIASSADASSTVHGNDPTTSFRV